MVQMNIPPAQKWRKLRTREQQRYEELPEHSSRPELENKSLQKGKKEQPTQTKQWRMTLKREEVTNVYIFSTGWQISSVIAWEERNSSAEPNRSEEPFSFVMRNVG